MKLSEVEKHLAGRTQIEIQLPDGSLVPTHFHVTEIGEVQKRFVDCGGTLRRERYISFQLWSATDYDHRLHPEKLTQIINVSRQRLGLEDLEVRVEYQGQDTLQVFALQSTPAGFRLGGLATTCLANEACGLPELEPATETKGFVDLAGACAPGAGCC